MMYVMARGGTYSGTVGVFAQVPEITTMSSSPLSPYSHPLARRRRRKGLVRYFELLLGFVCLSDDIMTRLVGESRAPAIKS
jgi:hypothetical protein